MVNLSKKGVKRKLLDYEFENPDAIIVVDGKLYLTDSSNARVKVHSTDYTFLEQYRGDGETGAFFVLPHGCDIANGFIYIGNATATSEYLYKHRLSDRSRVASMGGARGSGDDYFDGLVDIHIKDGYVYVADSANHRLKKHLASDLSFVAAIGTQGSGDDEFEGCTGVCTDGAYLYVSDFNNHRIKKLLVSDLSYVAEISGVNDPRGICVHGGYLYCTSGVSLSKYLLSDLSFVSKVGSYGSGDDQFSSPRGLCTDGVYLYVPDTYNDRIKTHLCSDLSYVSKFGYTGAGCAQCIGL